MRRLWTRIVRRGMHGQMESISQLKTCKFIFLKISQTLCCQILHIGTKGPRAATLPCLLKGDRAISSFLQQEPPSFMISNDCDGVSPSTTDNPGDILFRKDTQLDYSHESASFLEDCLDLAPLWGPFNYLTARYCWLTSYILYSWSYCAIIPLFSRCFLNVISVPGATPNVGQQQWRRQSQVDVLAGAAVGSENKLIWVFLNFRYCRTLFRELNWL